MASRLNRCGRIVSRGAISPGVLIAAFILASCATAAVEGPSSSKLEAPIVVIGDLHGDYDAYMALMREAGLVDQNGDWSGGSSRFVQTGDIPDRGPNTRKIIDHLMALEKQAERDGGEVIALIGNHEAMNITGDLRYVDSGEYAAFADTNSAQLRDAYYKSHLAIFKNIYRGKDPALTDDEIKAAFEHDYPLGYVEHRRAWAPEGKYGEWVASHDAMRIISETLFVHGGVSLSYASISIDDINQRVRRALKNQGTAAILDDEQGPLWYRGNAAQSESGAIEVRAVLEAFGVARIVIGHTPMVDGVKFLYDGKVIVVDTGISASYKGTRSFLRIDGDTLTAIDNGVTRVAAPSEREQ